MNIDKALYQDFLRQKHFIEALSATDDDLHRLFFQDQVIEHLSAEEQQTYMQFLLGSRPANANQISAFHQFTATPFRRTTLWRTLTLWWQSHRPHFTLG